MPEFANRLDAIPLVATTAERGTTFPTPSTGQRVQNLETGAIERYTGSSWHTDVFTGAVDASAYALTDAGFKAAVAAAANGKLLLPPGYTVTTTSQTTIAAETLVVAYGATVTASALVAGTAVLKATASRVRMFGGKVVGPSAASYVLDECGLWFYGTSGSPITDCLAEDVEVTAVGSYGILYEYANRSKAHRCYVHDVGYGGICNLSSSDWSAVDNDVVTVTPGTAGNAYGMYVSKRLTGDTTPTRGSMKLNRIRGVAVWEGLDTHGATYYTIDNNVVSGCKVGIQVGPDSFGNVPHFTTISHNTITAGGLTTTQLRGISIGGDGSTNVRGIVCNGNTIDTMGGADGSSQLLGAILVQYTLGSVCSGNTIYNAEQNGIIYDGGGNTGIVCTNNAIHGVALRTGNASGIRFNTATTGVCTGNYIDATDNYPLYFNVACPSLRLDDTNVLVTDGTAPASGSTIVGVTSAGRGTVFRGTATFNPANLADGAGETTTVTVTGAVLGDFSTVSFSNDLQGISVTSWVSASNTVSVRFQNESGGALDIASGTLTALVTRA